MKIENVEELRKIAKKIRISIIEQVYRAKSGHPGGSLSSADILTVLYFNQMNINEKEPKAILRDRFVLSKGHCAPVLYATLAEKGFFNKEELLGFRKVDGNLMFLDIDAVKEFYEDYVAAGGTKQDLSEVANSYPCEVKDID